MLELLIIGDELLAGVTADAHTARIAQALQPLGITIARVTITGDAPAAIAGALRSRLPDSRVVLVTGGLGPTEDDRTAAAAAQAFGRELEINHEALARIERFYQCRGRAVNPSSRSQAQLPHGCEVIANPVGTAPAFALRHDGCEYIFLPGVPRELDALLSAAVIPRVQALLGAAPSIVTRTVKTFGLWESIVHERLADVLDAHRTITVGFYPRFPEVTLRLTARGRDENDLAARLSACLDAVRTRLQPHVYAEQDCTIAEVVGQLLRERGQTIALAESCTGGLISAMLTDVPGSSAYLDRSLVVYSNPAKQHLLGVPDAILQRCGAVSAEVARLLADQVRTRAATTYGLSVTGIAGPAGGSDRKPVGTVYIGLAGPDGIAVREHRFSGTRQGIRTLSAHVALHLLRTTLLGLPPITLPGQAR